MGRFVSGFRLSAYGAAYFFASGAFMSYWPVWLRDRGITDSEIGTLFMSRQLVSELLAANRDSAAMARSSASSRTASAGCVACCSRSPSPPS